MIGKWWKGLTNDPARIDPAEDAAEAPLEIPVVRCPSCGGRGAVLQSASTGHHPPEECWFCKGRGLVRAQLVISLVDLPTGRVASRSIVPGVLTPGQSPPPSRQAALDLAAVVRELAADLAVQSIWQASFRTLIPWNPENPFFIPLRHALDADLSEEWRFEYEGAAIARQAQHRPQLIFYAGVESKPGPSADESLRRLERVAGDLQLDLVLDVRVERSETLIWSVRLDLPGDALPERPSGRFNTLQRALRETSVEAALAGLRSRSVSAPARWLETSSEGWRETLSEDWGSDHPEALTWAELSAKLTPLASRARGRSASSEGASGSSQRWSPRSIPRTTSGPGFFRWSRCPSRPASSSPSSPARSAMGTRPRIATGAPLRGSWWTASR
jgi:hypothetical protein